MAQGESPRNPLAFASVFYPGRCLASQPTGSGGGFAVVRHDRRHARSNRTVLLPPSLPISLPLCSRLRCPVSGVYPATWTAHAAELLSENYAFDEDAALNDSHLKANFLVVKVRTGRAPSSCCLGSPSTTRLVLFRTSAVAFLPGEGLGPASFDFCLSTSIPVLTTSTYVVAWPQGDQILGGGLVAQGHGRTSEPGKHKKKYPRRGRGKKI